MKPFKLFLSHCEKGPERPIVSCLYNMLAQCFAAEINDGSIQIFYDGQEGISLGRELRKALVEEVKTSDLVIACFFSRWKDAEYFKDEVKTAIKESVNLIPVLVLRSGEFPAEFNLGDLHRSLEESSSGRSEHVALSITCPQDASLEAVKEALKPKVCCVDHNALLTQIRRYVTDRARRDLSMYDSADQVLNDLSVNPSSSLNFFMYDGGTTIRRLAANRGIIQFLAQQTCGFRVKFLYVDTSFRPFIQNTPEYRNTPGIDALNPAFYAPLYEALVRESGMVHNESPNGHMGDVKKSVGVLNELAKRYRFELEVRKTCQVPFYRMITTRNYAYYTHFLPTHSEVSDNGDSPEYHSLRLSAKSPAGDSLIKHFEHLWGRATPHVCD